MRWVLVIKFAEKIDVKIRIIKWNSKLNYYKTT